MLSVRELLDSAIEYANQDPPLTDLAQLQHEVRRIHTTLIAIRERLYGHIDENSRAFS